MELVARGGIIDKQEVKYVKKAGGPEATGDKGQPKVNGQGRARSFCKKLLELRSKLKDRSYIGGSYIRAGP